MARRLAPREDFEKVADAGSLPHLLDLKKVGEGRADR